MAELRKIIIPELIKINTVVDDGNGKQVRQTQDYTFQDYVAFLVNTQESFNKNGSVIRTGDRILAKLDTVKKSEDSSDCESIVLDEPDWTLLKQTSESPTQGYPFGPTRLLLSFLNAINDAEKA